MINSLLNFYEEHKGTFHSSTVSTFFTELSEKLGIPGNRISEKFIRLKHQYRVTADNLNKKGGMNPDSIIYKRMDKLFASSKTSPAASVPVSISVSKDISTESTPSIIKTVPAPSNIPSTITGSAISMPISAPNPPANGGMNKIVFSSGRGKDSAISISSKPISISNGNSVITPTPLPPAPKPSFTELSQFTHNFSSKEIHCPPNSKRASTRSCRNLNVILCYDTPHGAHHCYQRIHNRPYSYHSYSASSRSSFYRDFEYFPFARGAI
ncbi:hypothetical protein DSO57_1008203 [Entomophthora muscae]|uniref:Uncharacterized protein n=1 Tax=Entomophthora muscae TaxID=34485 RepID=A0ACC2SWB6_9FUNG|nr:hypothetical protein DSO57_1008203 [Entomophthora muscae]